MGLLVALGFIRHLAMMACNYLARPCAGGFLRLLYPLIP